MTKVQRQHCRGIRLDATSWRFWLKRCSCCFGTLTRLKNTPDISADNKFTVRLWERHHVPFLWLVLSYVPSSGRVADRSHRRVRVWVLTVEHGVVDGGEQEVCGQVLSEELQGVQFSQQVSCREACSRLSIYINDNNHFQTIWTQTDFSEGKTHCSGANKRSVQTLTFLQWYLCSIYRAHQATKATCCVHFLDSSFVTVWNEPLQLHPCLLLASCHSENILRAREPIYWKWTVNISCDIMFTIWFQMISSHFQSQMCRTGASCLLLQEWLQPVNHRLCLHRSVRTHRLNHSNQNFQSSVIALVACFHPLHYDPRVWNLSLL